MSKPKLTAKQAKYLDTVCRAFIAEGRAAPKKMVADKMGVNLSTAKKSLDRLSGKGLLHVYPSVVEPTPLGWLTASPELFGSYCSQVARGFKLAAEVVSGVQVWPRIEGESGKAYKADLSS